MTSHPPEGAHYGGSKPDAATPPRPPGRRRIRAAALLAAAAAGLAGTLAALADLAWWLELFAHFRPQYAACLVVAGATLVAFGARAAGIAALLLAGLNAMPLLHYYHPPPAPAPPGPALRITVANIHYANADHQRLLDYLRRARPDVVILLEATPAWRDALAGADGIPQHQAYAGDVLVASRTPLAGLRSLPFGGGLAGALVFGAEIGGQPVTIIGAHANWPLGPRTAARRNAQLAMLAQTARAADTPVLLLGDLNVTAFSPQFARLLQSGGLADCAAGRGFTRSWPVAFPPLALRIDHCLHGPGLVPVSIANGPSVGSDHYPLEVVLRLRPGPGTSGEFRTAAEPPTFRR